jgi:phosphatidylserine synthase
MLSSAVYLVCIALLLGRTNLNLGSHQGVALGLPNIANLPNTEICTAAAQGTSGKRCVSK